MSVRKHNAFIASEGVSGWYTTVVDDEIIEFEYPINALLIETTDDEIGIKIDNNEDIWYVSAGVKEGIENMTMKKIQVLNPAGTVFRWKGLL